MTSEPESGSGRGRARAEPGGTAASVAPVNSMRRSSVRAGAVVMRLNVVRLRSVGHPDRILSAPRQIMSATARLLLLLGSVNGGLAVILGAFGAHALRARIDPAMMEVYHTG